MFSGFGRPGYFAGSDPSEAGSRLEEGRVGERVPRSASSSEQDDAPSARSVVSILSHALASSDKTVRWATFAALVGEHLAPGATPTTGSFNVGLGASRRKAATVSENAIAIGASASTRRASRALPWSCAVRA